MADSQIVNIGAVAKHYRLKRHYSQEKVAELVGIDQSVISRLERGETRPDDTILMSISKALRFQYQEYYSGVGNVDPSEEDENAYRAPIDERIYELIPYIKLLPGDEQDDVIGLIEYKLKRNGIHLNK